VRENRTHGLKGERGNRPNGAAPRGTNDSFGEYLTVSLPARARVLRQNRWDHLVASRWDHVVASDPGGARLVSSLEVALSVGVTIALEYGFSQLAHPLWMSAPPGRALPALGAARLAAQHHGVTELSMLIGGIVAVVSTLVNGPSARNRAVTIVGLPIPFLAMFALGIELVGHHTLGLVVFALVVAVGVYARKFVPRFGPRAFVYGNILFVGYLFGFLGGRELRLDQLDWLAAIAWLAAAANLVLRASIFDPIARGLLSRSSRSFTARARTTISAAIDALGARTGSEARRRRRGLRRQLVRLNEAALMIDGRLADPQYQLPPGVATALHDQLFELELSLHNIGQLVQRLTASEKPIELPAEARDWLVELHAGHTTSAARAVHDLRQRRAGPTVSAPEEPTTIRLYALAAAVVHAGEALEGWARLPLEPASGIARLPALDVEESYESPVTLRPDGRLRGSAPVSQATAVSAGEHGLPARLRLGWAGQGAVRLAVAVAAACAAGSALSERRFYWAVIAVFIAFTGANTAAEQLSRALQRTIGTFVGILIGSLLATAIGPSTWSLAVIIPALTVGLYFIQVSYWLMAVGITIMVSELYVQLGEFSNGLLVLRLEETALGAVIAMLAAVLIFPVGTRRAAMRAATGYLDALGSLITRLPESLLDPPGARRLSADSRALDDALQQLRATAHPLTWYPSRRDAVEHRLAMIIASSDFARKLASEADRVAQLDDRSAGRLREALEPQQATLKALRAAIHGERNGATLHPIVDRLAALDRDLSEVGAGQADPRRKMLRTLGSLDATLVELGGNLGLTATEDADDEPR
jgi:uncharacterized membrane protein YgaE (UPF0421/DUF939 family)